MYELPPILTGSEQEQLRSLRDYLVRLARSLEREGSAAAPLRTQPSAALPAGSEGSAAAAREGAESLRALIVKTAHTVERHVETVSRELHEDYLALSDFGSYQESVESVIEATARGVVESYDFQSALSALSERCGGAESAVTAIRGQIRRGLITDPETGLTEMGIAIAEELSFTGGTVTENGLEYAVLSPGQTLGLYTATGWQFWINGSKRGWFDSRDGMLHIANLAVDNSLNLGAGWVMTMTQGLGLRCMGG